MKNTRIALITGANKGIGLQVAKDLARHGLVVLLGARNMARAQEAAHGLGPNAHAVNLDVTDSHSIRAASAWVEKEFGRLDVLVNNAAISHLPAPNASFEDVLTAWRPSVVSLDEVRSVFETNVFGTLAVTQAFLPLLRAASYANIVNVSSDIGSLTRQSDPNNPYKMSSGSYAPSKSALNALTVALANELSGTSVKVNSVCPGFTATGLSKFRGTRTVEQAAVAIVGLAMAGPDGPHGQFSNEVGPIPW